MGKFHIIKPFQIFNLGCMLVILSGQSCLSRPDNNTIVENELNDSVATAEEDTLQRFVDQRQDSIFTDNIFAGLTFGINKLEYEKLIKKFQKEFDNHLYFLKNEKTISYPIKYVRPNFYKNKLYEIEVNIDNYKAGYELEPIFESKYGPTKNREWKWKNVEIVLMSHSRIPFDPDAERGYGSSFRGSYYEYPGSRTLTKNPGYTTISYRNIDIYNLKRAEELRDDSIKQAQEKAKSEKKEKRDLEKAMKYKENI